MALNATYPALRGAVGAGGIFLALALAVQAQASQPAPIAVPSGQVVTHYDTIIGNDSASGTAVRYRFIAPQISRGGGDVGFDRSEVDMQFLCDSYILPALAADALPRQIIVVLSDRPVEFGMADPDATQYFEAYRPENGVCNWEGF